MFEINLITKEINKAKFKEVAFVLGGENRLEVNKQEDCIYISALNKKNALKKLNQGSNGTKEINETPLKLSIF